MFIATNAIHPAHVIVDAVIVESFWPNDDDKPSYYAVPRGEAESLGAFWKTRGCRIRTVDDIATIRHLWIGIKECSSNGVAGWGRCNIVESAS